MPRQRPKLFLSTGKIRSTETLQGFAADPVYAKGEVFAYVGLPQNLKDLKDNPE